VTWVYIARCADGTLYVGHTEDLSAREDAHNAGHGARYTAARRPVRIVYSEQFHSTEEAMERERQLKGWTITKKEALVSKDVSRLKGISKRSRRKRSKD
jgi:predicted GIY-YIG superfamily endonuclease